MDYEYSELERNSFDNLNIQFQDQNQEPQLQAPFYSPYEDQYQDQQLFEQEPQQFHPHFQQQQQINQYEQQQEYKDQLQQQQQIQEHQPQQDQQNNTKNPGGERGVKRIHHYEIFQDRIFGKGTFGFVFEGRDTKSGKRIAVKKISLEPYKHHPHMIIPSLKNEVKNMQLLHHQNVVQLYNVFRTENNLYMMVEACDGGNLEQTIRDKSKSEEACLGIMAQIVEGFKCLRENNIVHRDLKPQNILMHRGKIKIADFGFSKLVSENMDEATLLSFVGTPLYMSPQILRSHPYSSKTDIWSLGIIFYEMMYGKRPWEAKGIGNMIECIMKRPLIFPSVPRVSQHLQNIIGRMLVEREDDRITWEELFAFFSPESLRSIVNKSCATDPYAHLNSSSSMNFQAGTMNHHYSPTPQLTSKNSGGAMNDEKSVTSMKNTESSDVSFTVKSESDLPSQQQYYQQYQHHQQPPQSQYFSSINNENLQNTPPSYDQQQQQQQQHYQQQQSYPQQQQQQQQEQSSYRNDNSNIDNNNNNDSNPPEKNIMESSMNSLLEYFNQKLNYSQHLQMVMFMQNLISKNQGENLSMTQIRAIMIQQYQKMNPQKPNSNIFNSNMNHHNININSNINTENNQGIIRQTPTQEAIVDARQQPQQQQQQQQQDNGNSKPINKNFVFRPIEISKKTGPNNISNSNEGDKQPQKLAFPTLKFVSPLALPFLNRQRSRESNNNTANETSNQ